MNKVDYINAVFKAIDQFNVTAFSGYFTDNAVFRFANQAPVTGKMAIQAAVSAFLQTLKSIEHTRGCCRFVATPLNFLARAP